MWLSLSLCDGEALIVEYKLHSSFEAHVSAHMEKGRKKKPKIRNQRRVPSARRHGMAWHG